MESLRRRGAGDDDHAGEFILIITWAIGLTSCFVYRREHTKKRKVSGELNLICYWEDRRKTRLCVRVARAVDVKAADVEGTSDPYVVGTLRAGVKGVQGREDQVYRTKTVKVTLFWLFWLFLVILVIFGYFRMSNWTDVVFSSQASAPTTAVTPATGISTACSRARSGTRRSSATGTTRRTYSRRVKEGRRGTTWSTRCSWTAALEPLISAS